MQVVFLDAAVTSILWFIACTVCVCETPRSIKLISFS